MSELTVGSLSGLAANSYVIDVASGSTLDVTNATGTLPSAQLPAGSILQVVRATDATDRTTTSTTFVDANISVTITPQRNTSAILLIWANSSNPDLDRRMAIQITDNSNNAVSGAESHQIGKAAASGGQIFPATIIGYATPATLLATTYKGRFCTITGGTALLANAAATGQLYAIEVAA